MKKTNSPLYILGAIFMVGFTTACDEVVKPNSVSEYTSPATYRYQPLNPTTVWYDDPTTRTDAPSDEKFANWQSTVFKNALLNELDNETVRISLDSVSSSGKLNTGVVGTSISGQDYVLILDYIKYNASCRYLDITYHINKDSVKVEKSFKGRIPVYTGIGLRIRAEFKAHQNDINISGLPALSTAASNNSISGRLTVSTLGITGRDISPLMPIISDISVTSIQNAVQAIGSIKSKIYEDDTIVALKVIGYESPSSNLALIEKITEQLYGSDFVIYPIVSNNPEKPKEKVYWINWKMAHSCNPKFVDD